MGKETFICATLIIGRVILRLLDGNGDSLIIVTIITITIIVIIVVIINGCTEHSCWVLAAFSVS
jgi:hypothetical protein